MPRAPKHCAAAGCGHLVVGVTFCPQHKREAVRRKAPSPTSRLRDRAERRRRSDTVARWVAEHGWVCPGVRRPAHPSRDLTAEHVVAVTNGGLRGPLIVLCRSCNSRSGT